jgi:hypothetical protein
MKIFGVQIQTNNFVTFIFQLLLWFDLRRRKKGLIINMNHQMPVSLFFFICKANYSIAYKLPASDEDWTICNEVEKTK